jgi:hypothetical protein
MSEETNPNTPNIDLNKINFDDLPLELFEKFKKSSHAKGLDKITNLRMELLDQEKLHLVNDGDFIDSYGKTVVAIATRREKDGVTLQELMTIMQDDFLRRALANLVENKVVSVVKLYPDGKESGNLKHIYLPDHTPVRK